MQPVGSRYRELAFVDINELHRAREMWSEVCSEHARHGSADRESVVLFFCGVFVSAPVMCCSAASKKRHDSEPSPAPTAAVAAKG